MDKQKLEEARQLAMSMTSHPVALGTVEHTEKAGELLGELAKAAETYAADAERFRWLAEHTVATGLARWVHPFQFLGEAVDARRKEVATNAAPRVTTAAELRRQAKSDMSCVGAFARARPGKA